MSKQDTDLANQTYTICDIIYRLEPQSWKQAKWLGETIFKDRDVQTIEYATIHDCGRDQAPLLMAIALLAEGQTREQKSKLAWSAIEALALDFEAHLTGWEVARFCTHFFYLCRPDQMVMLMTGRRMQDELHKIALSAVPGESGSIDPSWPSQTEISASLSVSVPSTDPLIQVRSCDEASNAAPLITPSLASAESLSHG